MSRKNKRNSSKKNSKKTSKNNTPFFSMNENQHRHTIKQIHELQTDTLEIIQHFQTREQAFLANLDALHKLLEIKNGEISRLEALLEDKQLENIGSIHGKCAEKFSSTDTESFDYSFKTKLNLDCVD